MVAMGTSLADGAWGRESAVYRITGVLTVIGGWFFTAFSAFLAAFLIASSHLLWKISSYTDPYALSIFILLRTHAFHKRRAEKQERLDNQVITASYEVLKSCDDEVKRPSRKFPEFSNHTYTNLLNENIKN